MARPLAPAGGDRQPAVAAERLRGHLGSRGVLPPLVLGEVHQADDPLHGVGVVACHDQFGSALVPFDVVIEYRVQCGVVGQPIGVELTGGELGRRRLDDDLFGDGRGLAPAERLRVAPPGEFPDQGLGHVLDRGEAARAVAVERGEPGGKLALVARGENQMTMGVRQRHQQRPADPGLQVLRGKAGEAAGAGQRAVKGVHHRLDRDHGVHDAGAPGQLRGVVHGTGRGVHRRHRDRVHPAGAEGVHGDRGDQRRVDTAGQPQHDRGEPVLADVVAGAGDHRGVELSGGVQPVSYRGRAGDEGGDGFARQHDAGHRHRGAVARVHRPGRVARCTGRQVEVDGQQRLGELLGAGECATAGVHHQRPAVEDELVLAADQVDVRERGSGLPRPGRGQFVALERLSTLVR